MPSVTQTIPSYTGGLSQQPDELKVPGQVKKAQNVLPDVTNVIDVILKQKPFY